MRRRLSPILPISCLLSLALAGCPGAPMSPDVDMTPPPADEKTAVSDVPLGTTLRDPHLSGAVDLVRDEWGIPHIYGRTMPDVAFAQGWVMASDRFVQMDLARHQADGSLGELLGALSPSVINIDIQYRLHHMRPTSEKMWAELQKSADPADQKLVKILESFAAGINLYLSQLKAGDVQLPVALNFVYQPASAKTWTPVDTLVLGMLQAFELSFDASTEIGRSRVEAKDAAVFGMAADPALKARAGISKDFSLFAPLDPTYTIDGWTGMNGDTTRAALPSSGPDMLALLDAAMPAVSGLGADRMTHPARGSNNWIVGPALTQTGHVMVANDTHLSLGNPATFYLSHLVATAEPKPVNMMGVQFPGIPGVILGMNEHVAWGATVNYIDVTDVYAETIVTCDGNTNPCVMFKGQKVPLVPRKEKFNIGKYGQIASTMEITYWDVPHHGPIVPRIMANHQIEPLGSQELSIRYTGYDGGQLFRALYGVDTASTMKEAVDSIDRDFTFGGQNWVIGDDSGNFGWTQYIRVPRRSRAAAPWKVMPGDGSAEWGPDMDPRYIPHAYNPAKNYLATANADPIGVTDDGDPWNEPVIDGLPLYLGADYDPGTRVGRITKRIEEIKKAGKKLSLEDMQSIQADAISEWGAVLAPVVTDAAVAITEEAKKPGSHPELKAIVAGAKPFTLAAIDSLTTIVPKWSFDTPSGLDEEKPTPEQIRDSLVTTVVSAWQGRFVQRALGDELDKLGERPTSAFLMKLIARMCTAPDKLQTGISKVTGDALLFDDLMTQGVIEGKREIAAAALVETIDYLAQRLGMDATQWRWGRVHGITLEFPAGIDALNIPTSKELPGGFPRHGSMGTVDVASFSLSTTDFTYSDGPAIRFVCDLDPKGPRARNALPGGETFDPGSSHYRDQMELWRANKTFDLAFSVADVLASANKEVAARKALSDAGKDDSNHPAGRIRFVMGN